MSNREFKVEGHKFRYINDGEIVTVTPVDLDEKSINLKIKNKKEKEVAKKGAYKILKIYKQKKYKKKHKKKNKKS